MVRDICTDNDILLIADEIMTGVGRTGKPFCVDHWSVVPDLITSAKGLAGGYVPAGAVLVRQKIVKTLLDGSGRFIHGFTYNGNPVSVTAGKAVLKFVKTQNIIENAERQENILGELLKELHQIPIVGDIRGKGLMWGVELVMDKGSREPLPPGKKAAEMVTH